jgi:membrane-bound inhibitor of C-type lysozyme
MIMRAMLQTMALILAAAALPQADLRASELKITLKGSHAAKQKMVRYECDANGVQLGLPTQAFAVDYINAGPNSLAVLPIAGESRIFVNVTSGSGARYAAGDLIWWEAAGRSITLTSDSLNGSVRSACKLAN